MQNLSHSTGVQRGELGEVTEQVNTSEEGNQITRSGRDGAGGRCFGECLEAESTVLGLDMQDEGEMVTGR